MVKKSAMETGKSEPQRETIHGSVNPLAPGKATDRPGDTNDTGTHQGALVPWPP